MVKVASTVPKSRFELFKAEFPAGWEIVYLDYPIADDALIAACQGADFLFVQSMHVVNSNVISQTPSLKMIHVEGVGFDKVDTAAAKEAGIPVCNNRAVNNKSVAEHTVGLMIAGLRRIPQADVQMKNEDFATVQNTFRREGTHELSSRHVGLIGMGAIGQETARMLQPFGCRISYYDAYRPNAQVEQELHLTYRPLDEIIKTCNVISMHVPVLKETLNMISTEQLAAMPDDTLLINTARGEIVDQQALAVALENGTIYGAALDTIFPEPPTADHPLYHLSPAAAKRLILTPHVGGTTTEAFERMLSWAIENMKSVTAGNKPNNVVNGVA